MTRKIGIDIGNVLIDNTGNLFFTDEYLSAPAVKGAFRGVQQIVDTVGKENTLLVSKCGPTIEQRSRDWLEEVKFMILTGFKPDNLLFCRHRHDKAIIANEVGLTDFIDDRRDVLEYMDGIVSTRVLFGPQKIAAPPGLIPAETWPNVVDILI